MKLTVLGNNGPYPDAYGSCSGYVLERQDKLIVLDLGSGSLSNFQKKYRIEDISFIILSHLHFDHMSDMLVLRYALAIKKIKLDVYLPKDPKEISSMLICDEFNLIFIDQSTNIERVGFNIEFKRVTHPVETYAIKVNNCFLYSGDLGDPDDLLDFGYEVDTLLVDSALLATQKGKKKIFHLSALECGLLANKLNTKRLILSHFPPYVDKNLYLEEASRYFPNTFIAQMLKEYTFQDYDMLF